MEAVMVEGWRVVYGGPRVERPRVITFKIRPRELEVVDRAALILGLSRSELIREALKYYISVRLGWEEWP